MTTGYMGFFQGHIQWTGVLIDKLIHVYDSEWNSVHSFGDYIIQEEEISARFNEPVMEIRDGVIHVVFAYFAVYRAYSIDGQLLVEQDLSTVPHLEGLAEKDEGQFHTDAYSSRGDLVYRAMDLSGNRLFILRHVPGELVIDEYRINDNQGLVFEKTHLYTADFEYYYALDFFYHTENNSFYVKESNEGIPLVSVYQPQ